MSSQSRRILTPGASRKRKEREEFNSSKPLSLVTATTVNNLTPTTSYKPPPQQLASNQLLAGYLACEFLTQGTLLGQKFDPARAEAITVGNNREAEPSVKVKPYVQSYYSDVANLLRNDGAHIPGIVNPAELSRWVQM